MSFPKFDPMKKRHMVCMAMAFASWVMHQPTTFQWLDTFKPLNFAAMILALGGVYMMAPNGDAKPVRAKPLSRIEKDLDNEKESK